VAELRALMRRHKAWIAVGVAAALLAVSLIALDRLTNEVRLTDVKAALASLTPMRVALALGFTALSYLALTFYDVLALSIIGRPLPWRTAATASFTSYTLSHNLGVALLTGGSARYRVYTAAGLDGPDIARVIGLAAATFWTGVATVAGVALALHTGPLALPGLALEAGVIHLLGYGVLATAAITFAATCVIRTPVRLFGFVLPLPRPAQFGAQLLVAAVDLACASAALFVLIPAASPALLPAFILAYALGIIAAVVTHVPGGIGVFEAVVLSVLPGDRATLLAALVAYRVIYYLLPFAIGIVVLAVHEGRRQRGRSRLLAGVERVVAGVAPLLLSTAVFGGGALLLLSGALPAIGPRMADLARVLPLPFIEASHLANSFVGTLLLLLTPGLYRRLDGANLAARVLLVAGALFSLGKGIDYEEAIACLTLAALLQWTRRAFYRHTALTQAPLGPGWMASVAAVLGTVTWVGFFAFRHVDYSGDLWWRFALHGDAPRFLRAGMACLMTLGGAALWRLLAPAKPPLPTGSQFSLHDALAHAERTDAMLAFTGDKRFLWSERNDAFVMYAVTRGTWAMMGDPVGPREEWAELMWRLREQADRAQARLLLYEISATALDLAMSIGLQIVKFGEEAMVDLPAFDIDTPRLRSPRRTANTLARKGLTFRIVPAGALPVIIDELAAVSDEWLAAKKQREKRFSLGRFDRAYLANFDTAVVMADDRIVAFANLWLAPNKSEASVDLMRHRADAPSGTMDYLFVQMILWAKARGYRRFSLGMAPLSGITDRRLAPRWARLAGFAFRHGERFYGFRGLRTYKEKFAPRWEPRYVAGPHGLGMILALRDLSALIGGRVAVVAPDTARANPDAAPTGGSPLRLPRGLATGLTLAAAGATAVSCSPALLGGRPMQSFAAAGVDHGVTALFVSGDSGLRFGMAHALSRGLARHGIGVLGINSGAVFARTGTRAAVDQVVFTAVRHAAQMAGSRRLLLVGQSFGADMLATSLPDLPLDLRARVAAVVLVVPGRTVFFHADPIGFAYRGTPDALPAAGVRALDWAPVTCIQGAKEPDSLCPELAGSAVTTFVLPGGHALNRDNARVTRLVLDRLPASA